MDKKQLTAFRLYPQTLERMDTLVANPPPWLSSTGVHPVQDRTDLLERLIFWVSQQQPLANTEAKEAPSKPVAKKPVKRSRR